MRPPSGGRGFGGGGRGGGGRGFGGGRGGRGGRGGFDEGTPDTVVGACTKPKTSHSDLISILAS